MSLFLSLERFSCDSLHRLFALLMMRSKSSLVRGGVMTFLFMNRIHVFGGNLFQSLPKFSYVFWAES